jgi:GTP-binding protein LepA
VLEAIVKRVPPPSGKSDHPLAALIFDSWYDTYQGVVVLIRVFDGQISPGMKIKLFSSGKEYEVNRVGIFSPETKDTKGLSSGEVGFIIAGIKNLRDVRIGDTVIDALWPIDKPLPGFKELKPMVFCGIYPSFPEQYNSLREALEKLRLNDSSFVFEPENSVALGFGFRCGFLGLLHKEIIQERLEREFNLELISTAPHVVYQVTTSKGEVIKVESPDQLPPASEIAQIAEPYILASIHTPINYLGDMLKLCEEKRGIQRELKYLSPEKVVLKYELPLNEVVWDFNDRLKSLSRGYASFDYEFLDFRKSSMVKLDILLNGAKIDALSLLVPKEKAYPIGKGLVEKIKKVIPRHLFEVVIQAAIGSKVIARDSIPPLRKNVTAKCYGGDITRKRKLLEKQKEGKKRMKQVGKISIPQEAFLSILKLD